MKHFKRYLALFLALICVLALFPLQAVASGETKPTATPAPTAASTTPAEVDVFEGGETVYAVQVASSSVLSNCKSCVEKLRNVGYNAYIIHISDSYRIEIGAFDKKEDAESLAKTVQAGPAVKGVNCAKAFVVQVQISSAGKAVYKNWQYNATTASSAGNVNKESSSITIAKEEYTTVATDAAVDTVTKNESNKTYRAVQVASSGKQSSCETCVKRMREAGYNAYIYYDGKYYRILVGVFDTAARADEVALYIQEGPSVKGVNCAHAYVVTVNLPDSAKNAYAAWKLGTAPATVTPTASSTGTAGTDVQSEANGTEKVYVVQVANSNRLDLSRTCIGRLQDIGYNAYLYQPTGGNYKLVIGAFDTKEAAETLAKEVRTKTVKGVQMQDGFVKAIYLSKEAKAAFANSSYSK